MNGTPPLEQAPRDKLFVANTRPSAPGGVPFPLTIGGTFVVVIFSLLVGNFFWMALLVPGWAFLRYYASKDLHIAETMIGWMNGAGRSAGRKELGGSSVSPLAPSPSRFGIFR